jgi:GNAT superfamily N-acetyltransferase
MSTPRFTVNVRPFRGESLGSLLEASEAEGFAFLSRLLGELSAGIYTRPSHVLLGAYGDDLIGVCGLTPDPYLGIVTPPVGRVRHLYVMPEYRRVGVGRALVEAIVAAARPHYACLRLRTTTVQARAFYQTLGFLPTHEPDATHVLDFGL